MIKKIIFVLALLPAIYSCQNKEINTLNEKIKVLEGKNSRLLDSLNQQEINTLMQSRLIGIPDVRDFKVNQTNGIRLGFFRMEKNRKVNIYILNNETNKKELIEKDWENTDYYFEFTPKSITDNKIDFLFEYKIEDTYIEIPGSIYLDVIE